MNDLRFAFRQLRKTPGFSLLAIVTLGLSIGLNTTIFSLVDALFLRGLPFKEPQRVVHIFANEKGREFSEFEISAPRFMHLRDGQTIFEELAADTGTALTLTGLGDPVQLLAFRTTANYFDLLGVRPIIGRNFLANEEHGADVALVSEKFWRKRLGGDANVVGRAITLNGTAHTIVGVVPNLPITWTGPNVEVWTTKPFVIPGFTYERMMRGTGFLRVVARLKAGVKLEQVRAALPSLDQSYHSAHPEKIDANFFISIKTLPEDVTGNLRPGFTTLFGAVTFVLLIACSNVANLLLVRFSGRRREIALRLAVGASRVSVMRLFLSESLLVSAIAGIAGAALAWQLVPLLPKLAANFLPLDPNTVSDLSISVLAFTILLSILTALLIGVYPALQSSRADLVDPLKEGGRGTSGSARQQRFRKILVGAQVALSMTLLAGAALLTTSFVRLSHQPTGFNSKNLWVGGITFPETRYPDVAARVRFTDQLQDVLRQTAGFQDVAISGDFPLVGGSAMLYASREGNVPPVSERKAAPAHDVAPGYLRTWGIPILAGRDFDQHDTSSGRNVILMSQAGAKKLFGTENAIGKTLLVASGSVPVEIIGIVGDVRSVQLTKANDVEFYRPWAQENFPFAAIAVRSTMKTEAVTRLVQAALNHIDPGLAITIPQSMEDVVAQALGQARLMMILLSTFAGVALLLAAIGIYGVLAYTVEQRTGEIGVRMALGAQTTDILRLIVGGGMTPVIIGLGIGIIAALSVGRLIASQLYQTSAHNPLLLSLTLLTLGVTALLACVVPARRAALLDPVQALRAE